MIKKINIGSGKLIKKGWDNLDIHRKFGANIIWDLNKFPYPFRSNTYDYVSACAILEHLTNAVQTLDELVRILKVGGKLEVEVPYGDHTWNGIDHKREFRFITLFGYCERGDDEQKYNLEVIAYKFKTRQTKFRRKFVCWLFNQLIKVHPYIIDYTFLRYFNGALSMNVIYRKLK